MSDPETLLHQRTLNLFQLALDQDPSPPTNSAISRRVIEMGHRKNQPIASEICKPLLLKGSRLEGIEHLQDLNEKAQQGHSTLICANHTSNFDVPNFYILFEAHRALDIFHRIIWIAGRKLGEDGDEVAVMARAYNRLLVSPRSYLEGLKKEEDRQQARLMNIYAQRALRKKCKEGYIFALFPAGTRTRDGNPSTQEAIAETASYLKIFEFVVFCHQSGCTLPATNNTDMLREKPKRDKVVIRFSPVYNSQEWMKKAAENYDDTLSYRDKVRKGVMDYIQDLSTEPQ